MRHTNRFDVLLPLFTVGLLAYCDVGCVRMDVKIRDNCGPATEDELYYVWVVAICIGCVRFIIKVRRVLLVTISLLSRRLACM